MAKRSKEISRMYRVLQREFDEAVSFADWKGRAIRILAENSIPVDIWQRLVDSICSI